MTSHGRADLRHHRAPGVSRVVRSWVNNARFCWIYAIRCGFVIVECGADRFKSGGQPTQIRRSGRLRVHIGAEFA